MKRSSLGLLLLMLVCTYSVAQPVFRYKRIVTDVNHEGWYSVTLPANMFQHLNDDLTDLRLYSLDGRDTVEVPYLLRILQDEVIKKEVELPLFNTSYNDDVLYLTFELPPSHKVNSLRLDFDENNYFGHVTIEGTDDRLTWFDIAKNERIVSIERDDDDYTLSTVRFPLSSYRFIRLKVTADTMLHLQKASFAYDSIRPGKYRDIALNWHVRSDKNLRLTTVDISTENYGPVSMLNVQVDEEMDYYRHFGLEYVSDSIRTPNGWIKNYKRVLNNDLTSFTANSFQFPVTLAKEFRVVVNNRDNTALNIKGISAAGPYVTIVSYLKPGDNFLFYGVGELREASYDLTHFQNTIPSSLAVARLGPEEPIESPEETSRPLFESALWLWCVMGVMIAGLGFFTIKMMKGN